jgi:hypothetical protein
MDERSDIEKIIELSTTKFPEINLAEAEVLLLHLAQQGYRFNVQQNQYLTVGSIEGPPKVDRGTAGLSGQIFHLEYGPSSFSLERELSDDLTKFTSFRFFNVSYRSEELLMWNDVKEKINTFYDQIL